MNYLVNKVINNKIVHLLKQSNQKIDIINKIQMIN